MNPFPTIKLHQLRNGEYLQLLRDAIALVATAGLPPTPRIDVQLAALTAFEQNISAMFGRRRGSLLTAEVEALDARRDAAITGITMVADGYTRHFNEARRAAAVRLAHTLGLYGIIAGENYMAESAELSNLTARLGADAALSAAVAELGLADWVAELAAANAAFTQKFAQRTAELAAGKRPHTMVSLRVECNKVWMALRRLLDSYLTINDGAEPWSTAVSRLNTLTKEYAETLNIRKGASAARRKRAGGGEEALG